jgi:hypothetical protein
MVHSGSFIFIFFLLVVHQVYETGVADEYVISGNGAIFKCNIPSFVAEFVEVMSWHTSTGEETFYANAGRFGTFFFCPVILFHYLSPRRRRSQDRLGISRHSRGIVFCFNANNHFLLKKKQKIILFVVSVARSRKAVLRAGGIDGVHNQGQQRCFEVQYTVVCG